MFPHTLFGQIKYGAEYHVCSLGHIVEWYTFSEFTFYAIKKQSYTEIMLEKRLN